MAGKNTGKRILTALIVILVLILSLGVLSPVIWRDCRRAWNHVDVCRREL